MNERPHPPCGPTPPCTAPRASGPRPPWLRSCGWLAATIGALALAFALQIFGALVGYEIAGALVAASGAAPGDVSLNDVMAIASLTMQVLTLLVFGSLWWWVGRRSFVYGRRAGVRGGAVPAWGRAAAIVIMGLSLQVALSFLLTYLLPLFPDLNAEYSELMDDSFMSELSVLSLLVVAVLAPVTEELICRGVIFEFSLRAVCPAWAARWVRRGASADALARGSAPVPPIRFWLANVTQAALFGILHLNLVQGLYAFGIGLMLGWLVWCGGRLRYGMGAHLMVNFSSFFVAPLAGLFQLPAGPIGGFALSLLSLALGVGLFSRFSQATFDAAQPLTNARGDVGNPPERPWAASAARNAEDCTDSVSVPR